MINKKAMLLIFIIVLNFSINLNSIVSKSDSVNSKDKNMTISIIKGWQALSFNSSILNCQFHPCCSNYCIEAIERFGTTKGILLGADRISRCHPYAKEYYYSSEKGIIDPVPNHLNTNTKDLNYNSVPISYIIPGLDKVLNGKYYDGISIFLITGLSLYRSISLCKDGNLLLIPYSTIFLIFYSSNIFRYINL
jgi:uncharacterized protein